MYQSDLSGQLVIGDDNWQQFAGNQIVDGREVLRGYVPRDYSKVPPGSVAYAAPFPIDTIPQSEWRDRIEEREKTKSTWHDIRKQAGLKSTNQGSIPYCWIHGCVNAVRLARCRDGQEYADLEPTSAGALIKRYRKVGGNTPEAIRHLAEHGVATTEHWPPNSLDRNHDNEATRENAKKHRITEWWELRSNNFEEMATCLLLGLPVPCGFMWWGHLVCAMDLVAVGSDFGIRIWNSWGDNWGDNGEGILEGSKKVAFDQFALCTSTWSAAA